MNNRYFIRISLCGYKYKPQIETMDWYDDPDMLEYNMNNQLDQTIWKLSDMRGKYMKKLGRKRKGIEWFKEKVDKGIFSCHIEVIRFNHSFDNHDEFAQWCSDNHIANGEIWPLELPGDLNHRKMLQDSATDYYADIYDCHLNKINSISYVYSDFGTHKRSCDGIKFKPGDILSYGNSGSYKVLDIPEKYNSLYWHDGFIHVYDINNDDDVYEFDYPESLALRKE